MHKILMLDDDAAIRMLYSDELTEDGHNVLTCKNISSIKPLPAQWRIRLRWC